MQLLLYDQCNINNYIEYLQKVVKMILNISIY